MTELLAVLTHPVFALTVYPLLAFMVGLELLDDNPHRDGR